MKDKAQSLTDIFAWEKEVYAVRGEIARREVRKEYLSRLTSMATVNLTLRDKNEYIPETNPVYGETISGTFSASLKSLQEFGKYLLLILVALALWSPLILLTALFARLLIRRVRSRMA